MAERKGCFGDIRTFVACYGILVLTDIMAGVMKKSSLTTLERRFDLPSTIIALLASSFQIGNLTMLLFVSYFGSRWHRPRAIFCGSVLLVTGNLIVTLPQFLGGRYEYDDVSSNTSTAQIRECADNVTDISNNNCENKTPTNQLYILLVVGMMVNGVGGTPIQPLGLSYIDDFAHERNSPLYLGLTTSIALLGPMIGYVLSSVVLKWWVDIGWVDTAEITITPTHPSWVGAWWLGLIICTSGIAITMIPFLFFPKTMKKQEMKKKKKQKLESDEKTEDAEGKVEKEKMKEEENQTTFKDEVRDIPATLKRIFNNPIFLLILLKFYFGSASLVGIINFLPKYLEVAFGVSASRANFFMGVINIPCVVVGTLVGSILMKRYNLTPPGITKLIGISTLGAAICLIPMLTVGCETIDIAGITVPYTEASGNIPTLPNEISSCNINCGCVDGTYTPVCGSDGISYISPCHAGCTGSTDGEVGSTKKFTECSCISMNATNGKDPESAYATPERCEFSKCPNLLFVALAFKGAASFFSGLAGTPMYIFMIRSVQPKDKAFGIGIYLLFTRLLAWIPGPLVYGALIDSACLYWGRKPCTDKAYCKVYDNESYRLRFYGLMIIFNVFSLITILVLHIVTKKKYAKDQAKKKAEEKKNEQESIQINGNGTAVELKPQFSVTDNETLSEDQVLLTGENKKTGIA
uniref:solute carrier organic anion transporter family member 2A1-like isoform X1 n=2 Tax=Styela clava TaxID=7725 RepID=UPI001939BF9C|nr:solute carrier organic anion transporter family member 2A1-like isoform X1 [Styela clava]XP_039249920.1 solute carrier organic anion transporter family member 2A1-like isoform X1 [Styela clava]